MLILFKAWLRSNLRDVQALSSVLNSVPHTHIIAAEISTGWYILGFLNVFLISYQREFPFAI